MKSHVPQINVARVRDKVVDLVKAMGISKTKLGEVLGGEKTDDPRVKINRATRFLSGEQKRISLQEINALAEFFGKPVEWFLFDEHKLPSLLATRDRKMIHPVKPLDEIRNSLEAMGFEKEFIDAQIKQLKAMEAYNSFQRDG